MDNLHHCKHLEAQRVKSINPLLNSFRGIFPLYLIVRGERPGEHTHSEPLKSHRSFQPYCVWLNDTGRHFLTPPNSSAES